MHVFVTGANGCIGNVLVRFLLNSGHDVKALALDANDTDKIENIENAQIVFGNICDRERMEEIFSGSFFHVIIHLAGIVHNPEATLEECMEVNCRATSELFELSKKHGARQFIFASTVAVYGEDAEDTLDEDSPVDPQSPYATSKHRAEEYIKRNHDNSIKYTIIRPTTVYGKYDKGNINKMVTIAKKGLLPIIGDGNNPKSFVYVDNLAEGILKIISNERAYNETFILSDREPYSVNLIVKAIQNAMNKKVMTMHVPIGPVILVLKLLNRMMGVLGKKNFLRVSSVNKLATSNVFDTSKANKVLGYAPRYSLAEGLSKTYSDH